MMQTRQQIKDHGLRAKAAEVLVALAVVLVWLCAETRLTAESSTASEAQIKAVFLFNFAKYVDWPPAAFSNATTPITIGVMGSDPLGDDLRRDVEGKTINGRPFVIKHLEADSELDGCQILFISRSEASRIGGILDKASALHILTVGENEPFARNGGMISFVLKNGNVRLAINLTAARKAGLTISSRLLAVADEVKGKTD